MTNITLSVFGVDQTVIKSDELPREIAKIFAGLEADDQALFFECLVDFTERWERNDCFQWSYMQPFLTTRAKAQIRRIAEYAE